MFEILHHAGNCHNEWGLLLAALSGGGGILGVGLAWLRAQGQRLRRTPLGALVQRIRGSNVQDSE